MTWITSSRGDSDPPTTIGAFVEQEEEEGAGTGQVLVGSRIASVILVGLGPGKRGQESSENKEERGQNKRGVPVES